MPSGPYSSVKILGTLLVAASSFFFLETAFEMYFLTVTQGPQMVGFSLAHIAPGILILLFVSGIAFIALAIFALVLQILKVAGRLKSLGRYSTFMLVALCVQIAHGVLLMTYDRWSAALFP